MARLVGRDPELRQLWAAVDQVAEGRSATVTIEGEAGIGKTRLIEELLVEVTRRRWRTILVRASALDIDRPFAALADAIEAFEVETARDGGRPEPALAEALEALERAFGGGSVDGGGERVANLVTDALIDAAVSDPLVVVFDDAHWLDDASGRVLWQLVRRRHPGAVLCLATFRPTARVATSELRNGLDSLRVPTTSLQPLDQAQAEELAAAVLGTPPDRPTKQLLEAASGNPLFITELLRARHDRPTDPAPVQTDTDSVVPDGLRRLILRRLAVLAPPTLAALADASLLGPTFSIEELAQIRGVEIPALIDTLAPAVAARVLVERNGALGFQHILVQNVVAEDRPASIRRAMHRHMAQCLAAVGAPHARVAEHLWLGSAGVEPAVAQTMLRAAGEVQTLSLESSLVWTERALARSAPGDDQQTRIDQARLLNLMGRVGAAEAVCAGLLAEELPTDQRVRLHITCAALMLTSDPPTATPPGAASAIEQAAESSISSLGPPRGERAAAHVAWVLNELPPTDPRRIDAIGWQALHRLYQGDLDGARQAGLAAIDAAAQGPGAGQALPGLSRAHEAVALGDLLRGDIDAAQHHAHAAVSTLSAADELSGLLRSPHLTLALTLAPTGHVTEVESVLHAGRDLCMRAGHTLAQLHLHPLMAASALLRGDLEQCSAVLEATFERIEDWRTPISLPTITGIAAFVAALRDDLTSAMALAERAMAQLLADGAQAGSTDLAVWCIASVAEINGDRSFATDLLVGIWDLVGRHASLHIIAPDLVRVTRDTMPDYAAAVVADVEARARRSEAPLGRAHVRACRGFLQHDYVLVDEGASIVEDLGWTFMAARWRSGAVADLVAQGDRAASRTALAAIGAAWERIGAPQPLRPLRSLQRQVGVHRRPSGGAPQRGPGPSTLTPTERAVVLHVAEGRTNREIGDRMFVSHRTVETHVANALRKLGLTSRVQLAGLVATGAITR